MAYFKSYFSSTTFSGLGEDDSPIDIIPLEFGPEFSGNGSSGTPYRVTFPITGVTFIGTSGSATLIGGILNIPNYSATSIAWGNITGSIASQTDLVSAFALKANLAGPTFTGVPSGPTAAPATNTTQLATCAFVLANAGAASQTPWTSNIDGGAFNLGNVKDIQTKKVVVGTNENYFLHSNDLTNADWTIGGSNTILADQALDFAGNNTMELFTADPGGSGGQVFQIVSGLTPSTTYYLSFDVKRGTNTTAEYAIIDWDTTFTPIVNYTTYYSATSGTVSRVEFSFTTNPGNTTVKIIPYNANFSVGNVYLGRMMLARTAGAPFQVTTTSQVVGTPGSTTYGISTDSTNGRVGVNKATPTEALDVSGNALISGNISAANLAAGTYLPTLTNVSNVTTATHFTSQYMRIGNIVFVSGRMNVTPAAPGDVAVGISLPVASNISAVTDVNGVCSANGPAAKMFVTGDTSNDRAQLTYNDASGSGSIIYFNFSYTII